MQINPVNVDYKFLATVKNGTTLNISGAITDCSIEDPDGEISEHIDMILANAPYKNGKLSDVITPGCPIFIFSNWGAGMQEIFRGFAWDWDPTSSSDSKALEFSSYDNLKYLEQSEDNLYYSAGMDTKAIVTDICNKWGIPINYTYSTITHSKQVLQGGLSDSIKTVLDDAKSKLSSDYVVISRKGVLQVTPMGSNHDVCVFDGKNVSTMSNKLSMDDLVTKVIVYGKEDNDGRTPVEAAFSGRTEFGTLQKIVNHDSDSTLSAASTEAKKILQQNGNLSEDRTVDVPDVPFLRKGDKVRMVNVDSLNGYFYVVGVTHQPLQRMMTLQLKSATQSAVPIKAGTA